MNTILKNKSLQSLPYLGVGVGLRTEFADKILAHAQEIDVLEIIAESFFPTSRPHAHTILEKFIGQFPIIPHGVKLSIGSALPLEHAFLEEMNALTKTLTAHYYSDHYSLSHLGSQLDTGHLTPLWYTHETLAHVVSRINTIQEVLGIPLVLENITSLYDIPNADFEEPEFITEVCRQTGCGLLLDLTNIHINAYNRKVDALPLLKRYPIDAVVQVHIAGGVIRGGVFYDTHSEEISGPNEGVWDLLSYVAHAGNPCTYIIERDENFKENFEEMILTDLRRARTIVENGRKMKTSVSR